MTASNFRGIIVAGTGHVACMVGVPDVRTRRVRTTLAVWFAAIVLAGWSAAGGVSAATANPALPLRDNLVVRAVVAGERFRVEKEGAFQVYLTSTLPAPLSDVKLKVDSDQFEATVAPSPSWKTYPELPAVADGAAKGCFVVSLRRKAGSPDDEPDVALRVYAACRGARVLAATLTLAEALDEHQVPSNPSLKIDGKPSPQFWGNSLVLKDLIACRKQQEYLVGYKSTRPGSTNLPRVYLAADDENLYLLVATIGYTGGWFPEGGTHAKIFIASAPEARPFVLAVDEMTFKMTCTPPVDGAKCVRCAGCLKDTGGCDSIIYEVAIPRKAVGIDRDSFTMNFSRTMARDKRGIEVPVLGVQPTGLEVSCWRGNELSVEEPAVYGKMILPKPKTGGK